MFIAPNQVIQKVGDYWQGKEKQRVKNQSEPCIEKHDSLRWLGIVRVFAAA